MIILLIFLFLIISIISFTIFFILFKKSSSFKPRKLLIFYGWPSTINNSSSIQQAINYFSLFDDIVLGDGLQSTSHSDHLNTLSIISTLKLDSNKRIFGYITAQKNQGLNYFDTAIRDWNKLGVHGLLVDEFGADFGTSLLIQNYILDIIHSYNLLPIINAWDPDDVFKPDLHLKDGDIYLSESFVIENGNFQTSSFITSKAKKLLYLQSIYNFEIFAITTDSANGSSWNQNKFDYTYCLAGLLNYNSFGWGEFNFSSQNSIVNNRTPINLTFKNETIFDWPILKRKTNKKTLILNTEQFSFNFSNL